MANGSKSPKYMVKSVKKEASTIVGNGGSTKYVKIGPAGLTNTNDRPIAWDEKGHTKISRIYISYEAASITSIHFQYVEDGECVFSPVYIEHGGSKFTQITLEPDSEYITGLSGCWKEASYGPIVTVFDSESDYMDISVITSLTIETNKRKLGPFGLPRESCLDREFSFQFGPDNEFGGFYGTFHSPGSWDWLWELCKYPPNCLGSIGVYLKLG